MVFIRVTSNIRFRTTVFAERTASATRRQPVFSMQTEHNRRVGCMQMFCGRDRDSICAKHVPFTLDVHQTPRDPSFNATEHRPPITMLHRPQREAKVRQSIASDNSVLVGRDLTITSRGA